MKIFGATAIAALLALCAVACSRGQTGVAQYGVDAGYGMPNPQPGSPISPGYDAGISPIPAPSSPVPSPSPSPYPGTPTPSPTTP